MYSNYCQSMQIPAAKRQRISRLNKNKLSSSYTSSSSYHYNKPSPIWSSNELPKCSLVGIMKYLDKESLNTFTSTSITMYRAAKKYQTYQEKQNLKYIEDIGMELIDIDNTTNSNKNESISSLPSLSLSPLSVQSDDLPSLSLDIENNYKYNKYDNNDSIMEPTNYIIDNNTDNNTDINVYNHLTINSHLNLHLKCNHMNINNNDNNHHHQHIDIFEQHRCSVLDILNNIKQITL